MEVQSPVYPVKAIVNFILKVGDDTPALRIIPRLKGQKSLLTGPSVPPLWGQIFRLNLL